MRAWGRPHQPGGSADALRLHLREAAVAETEQTDLEEHATELGNVEVAEHDVLLNITGDSVGRTCLVDA